MNTSMPVTMRKLSDGELHQVSGGYIHQSAQQPLVLSQVVPPFTYSDELQITKPLSGLNLQEQFLQDAMLSS